MHYLYIYNLILLEDETLALCLYNIYYLYCVTGIVGAGIGGATAAFYARQLFGESAVIDIFEETRIGGRLALINIDGLDYEAGGTLIHPRNLLMLNFTEMLGEPVLFRCSH